jgi:hypothetical protein
LRRPAASRARGSGESRPQALPEPGHRTSEPYAARPATRGPARDTCSAEPDALRGLGQLTAAHLLARGGCTAGPAGLEAVVTGDLSNLDETRRLAARINELGAFDVIICNAGEYGVANEENLNADSLSPYVLTSLVNAPQQSVYLTSDLHLGGDLKLGELRTGGTEITCDDSKLQILTLAMAVARRRPGPASTRWPRAGCRR